MSNKINKTRKIRKQKGGSAITFLLGALSGGILASFFSGSKDEQSFGSSLSLAGGNNKKKGKKNKNSKTKKNKK